MKLNGNLVLTAALMATLSLMVACAPAKRGTKFTDRSGANGTGTEAEKVGGIKRMETPEAKEFRDQIVMIDAAVQESKEDEESQEEIDKLLLKYTAEGVSSLDPIEEAQETSEEEQDSDNQNTAGLKSKEPVSRDRAKYIMSVRVNIAGVGYLDLVGVSAKFGNAKMLRTLTHVNKDCATKYADLKIKAICADKSCSKLLVQLNSTSRGSQDLHIEEVLTQKETKDGLLKIIKFTEINRTKELEKRGIQVQEAAAVCKAKDETSEEAALTAAEAKAREEENAKAKKEDEKKKTDETEVDAIEALANE